MLDGPLEMVIALSDKLVLDKATKEQWLGAADLCKH